MWLLYREKMTAISCRDDRSRRSKPTQRSSFAFRTGEKRPLGTVGVSTALATMLSRKRERSQLMTEREFEEFWQTVDSRHRGLSPAKQLRRRAEEQARAL